MRLCGDAAGCDLPQSKRGGCHAEIWFVGACRRSRPCRTCDDRRCFARRSHRAIGFESDRRSTSPRANGNRPVQVGWPPLLLVQQRMARSRLVSLWLWLKARRGLGWSGRLARLATSGAPPADCSSAAPSGATDRTAASSSTSAAGGPPAATRTAGTPSSTPRDGVTEPRRRRVTDRRNRISRPACGR